jgi:hypothetical protein
MAEYQILAGLQVQPGPVRTILDAGRGQKVSRANRRNDNDKDAATLRLAFALVERSGYANVGELPLGAPAGVRAPPRRQLSNGHSNRASAAASNTAPLARK